MPASTASSSLSGLAGPAFRAMLARSLLTWSLVSLGEFEKRARPQKHAMALIKAFANPIPGAFAYVGQGLYQAAIGRTKAADRFVRDGARNHPAIGYRASDFHRLAGVRLCRRRSSQRRARHLLLEAEHKSAYRLGGLYNWIPSLLGHLPRRILRSVRLCRRARRQWPRPRETCRRTTGEGLPLCARRCASRGANIEDCRSRRRRRSGVPITAPLTSPGRAACAPAIALCLAEQAQKHNTEIGDQRLA